MSQIVCFGANTDGITVKASDSFLFNANLKYLFTVKSGKVCLCARTDVCVRTVCVQCSTDSAAL